MKLKSTLFVILISLLATRSFGQETTEDTLAKTGENIIQTMDVKSRLKFSGYIHAQYQIADSAGLATFEGGNFPSGTDKRFMLRRARLKAVYTAPLNEREISTSQYVFQIDIVETGASLRDMYAKFTDPWIGWVSVTAGLQNRPFGFDIAYSSSMRETPERGRMSQILFRNERDLGAMLTLQGPKTSDWNWIMLEAGLFNGVGGPSAGQSVSDFDKYKDFIGHLSVTRSNKSENVKWGAGVSYYNGAFRVDNDTIYQRATDPTGIKAFNIESSTGNKGKYYAPRKYVGVDARVNIDWGLGMTALRAEYIQGDQPAPYHSSTDPGRVTVSPYEKVTKPIFNRKFNGAYFYIVQNLGTSPVQAIFRYDWYDPNTDVKGDEIGKPVAAGFTPTNETDVKFSTIGLGLAYHWDANVTLLGYWDKVTNETTTSSTVNQLYHNDLEDDVLTLRVQVKF